ncbi:N-acetylmuramidase family protein [uncultured Muribaculum sp.]|uniref:N-acetylmuramidase family protein n=1 Tax=uncultured Muribaculum sp. TaxID=1918613 RepID=UPI0025D89148|nr:N-acetylmuramidase family protein [uncultured Muribaculum sp.]
MSTIHQYLLGALAIATIAYSVEARQPRVTPPDSLHILPENLWELPENPWSETARNTVKRLDEDDFRMAANELGIDVASMKAVVSIEAGVTHQGFHAPGKPLLNFDLAMFKRGARRRGINLAPYMKQHTTAFARPDRSRYGSYQAAQYARLEDAMAIDSVTAMENSFWGMFQIGGFNWKKCGTSSVKEFVKRMSASEHEQLELFVEFVKSQGLDKYLQKKDWAGFARRYNGPGYAKRRYHTRLARAYEKYRKEEKAGKK